MPDDLLIKRIEDLEIRVAYQENNLETLNGVIIRQQEQIDSLIRLTEELKQQIKQGGESVRPQSEEPLPPHY